MSAGPVLRGRRGRDRRVGEQLAGAPGVAAGARAGARGGPGAPGPGRRQPDLSALPALLAATGTFASLRERLGSPPAAGTATGSRGRGRHVGLTAVPHGAKTYLAATLAMGADGERLVWIARDAEIGDRVAEELGAWLGDPSLVTILEPRTALAYERSELVADETAARVAALAAWRSGRARILVASVQALIQHTIAPDDVPAAPRRLGVGGRMRPEALLRELLGLGYAPAIEVAGRGEFARRGGIVDVFPPSAALPVRIEFFGDEIDSLRVFDPTDQRTIGPADEVLLLPASEFLAPHGGVAALRERLGRSAASLPDRLASGPSRRQIGIAHV
jgi:transcription-repair coupling factor (superfamily II helicase)